MSTDNKHLLDQLTQLFKAELQPFKGQGRAKELAYASFKRQAKLLIKAYALSIQRTKPRSYSFGKAARRQAIANLGKHIGVLPSAKHQLYE